MTKKELGIIASALQHSKSNIEAETILFESGNIRPQSTKYYREVLIPEIDEAYKIVSREFLECKEENKHIPELIH